MSTIQAVRSYVNQRLTVAVEEILDVFERTMKEYEEELHRQRRLLGAERLPPIMMPPVMNSGTVVCQENPPLMVDVKVPPEEQESRPSLDPEGPCIKEEPEEEWIRQELDGADVPELQFTPNSVKSEDDGETPQSSLLQERQTEEHREADPPEAGGETCGGSEPVSDLDVAGFLKATRDGQLFLSHCFKSQSEDLHDDWKQPFSQALKDIDAESHKISHTQKKLYKCLVCNKTFKYNTALQRHVTCHTGERPFDCTECGKTFRQKGSLQIHMRKHTGEKPFCCFVCDKNFTQSGTLAAHMRIHTGEKPFSCSVCQNRYSEKGTLVRHMRVHTGEKPFTCSFCGKRFSEKGNLNKHKRIHTGEKPFSCSGCEKKFISLAHLKNHKCPNKSSETVEEALQPGRPEVTAQFSRWEESFQFVTPTSRLTHY